MKLQSATACALLLAALHSDAAFAQARAETLIVPLRGGAGAAVTSREYAGDVWVFVKGGGLAAGTQACDAFFVYTTTSGAILPPPGVIGINEPHPWHATLPANWVLRINDQFADALILPGTVPTIPGTTVPEYNVAHMYVFPISTPGGRLTLGVSDYYLPDNLGAYEVTIGTKQQALGTYVENLAHLMSFGYIWGNVRTPDNELHAALQRAARDMAAGEAGLARIELQGVLLRLVGDNGAQVDPAFAAFCSAAITYLLTLF